MINPHRYDIIEGKSKPHGDSTPYYETTAFYITCPQGKSGSSEDVQDVSGRAIQLGTPCLYNQYHKRFCTFASYSDARTVIDELNRLIDESNDAWRQGHIQGSLEPCHYDKRTSL